MQKRKHKKEKKHYTTQKFFTKLKKTNKEIFAFCVTTFEPIKI